MLNITAITRISLTSADADSLSRFYENALGFTRSSSATVDASLYGARGRALVVVLSLGAQQIELVQFDQPGAPYPRPCMSHDAWFQHFAIVVTDAAAALARLANAGGAVPISRQGPVQLPAASGGVIACKLRDPEMHPFELLQFPADAVPSPWCNPAAGPALGIDHSAITVSDTARSRGFYAGLGFTVGSQSLNEGPTQQRLDDLDRVQVEVTGLSPMGQTTPHLELLCYRQPHRPTAREIAANDIAATRLLVDADGAGPRGGRRLLLRDPDGHRLLVANGAVTSP